MGGLAAVAAALDENNLCLAQIAAMHLRLPDLPDLSARRAMEEEDLLIARERAAEALARAAWDPAKFVVFRPQSRSGGPAIDIKVPEIPFQRIHFTGR
jgi:hypothetical protein